MRQRDSQAGTGTLQSAGTPSAFPTLPVEASNTCHAYQIITYASPVYKYHCVNVAADLESGNVRVNHLPPYNVGFLGL